MSLRFPQWSAMPWLLLASATLGCVDEECDSNHAAIDFDAFCDDLEVKDDPVDCPAELIAADANEVYAWCWVFEDGWSSCGLAPDKKAAVHEMVVDVSCDVEYDLNGYPNKERPDPDFGDPAVLAYRAAKIKRRGDNGCVVDKACCERSALWE